MLDRARRRTVDIHVGLADYFGGFDDNLLEVEVGEGVGRFLGCGGDGEGQQGEDGKYVSHFIIGF
jgi:hypothetical protein